MLVLSQLVGSGVELVEVLTVNPYNIDQCVAAMHVAPTMSELSNEVGYAVFGGLFGR